MPLKVVTGRSNAGKTGWILRWALEALDLGESPTLVVPSLSDVRRMQGEVAGKAPFGVRVVTPQTLAEELWQLHGDGRRFIGDATRSAVVKQIMGEPLCDEIGLSSQTPGFETLLLQSARMCACLDQAPNEGMREASVRMTGLLARYRARLEALGMVEQGWVPTLLAPSSPRVGFLGFLRFTTFSESQLAMLCTLAERNTVCAALTWEDGFGPTRANDALAAALMARASELQLADQAPGDPELESVATAIRLGAEPLVPTGSVVLGEARGREAEAALVASMAARAVREGTPPERIAVVFRQLGPRLGLLKNALAAEDLEGDFDCPMTVGMTPFGTALIALLRLALGRGDRAEALQYLQGPFSDAEQPSVVELDKRWRKNRQTEDSVRILSDLVDLRGSSGEAAKLCRQLATRQLDEKALEQWQRLTDILLATAAAGEEPGRVTGQDAAAHRAVVSAMAGMVSVSGHPFTATDILEALPALSCALHSDEESGRVQIIQAANVGARRFDELIVAGLTQREFPRASRETFASEVRLLATGRRNSTDEAGADLEFYSLLTRPRRRLWLVRQSENSEGVSQSPSVLLERSLNLYRDTRNPHSGHDTVLPEVARCEDARIFAPVFTRGRRRERLLADQPTTRSRTVVHGKVDPAIAGQLTEGRIFSATEIDAYLQCPYGWFFSRVLHPRDIDAQMDAAALGSRAHGLIADFYKAMADEGRDRVTPESLADCLELFEKTASVTQENVGLAHGLAEEIDMGRAHLWARHAVEDDAYLLPGYVPLAHEMDFGRDSVFEIAGIPIAGRIDRIDVGPRGAIVTDYKSARDVGRLARPGAGFGTQHVLYALAAERTLGRPVVASVYRSLRSRQLRGFWREDVLTSLPAEACEKDSVDAEGFSAMVETLKGRISGAIEGMSAGEIPRSPQSAASCRYCGIRQICEGALT
jgi:hypothetical protein